MTHPAYENELQAWVRAAVAPFDVPAPTPPAVIPVAHTVQVVWADQDAPRPVPPYLTLKVISTRGLGRPVRRTVPSDEAESGVVGVVSQPREGSLEVQAYGAGHDALMSAVELSIRDPELMGALRSEGVAVETHGPRNRLGLATAKVVEDRSVAEFIFRYVDTRTFEVVGALGSVTTSLQPFTRTGPTQDQTPPPSDPTAPRQPPYGPGPIVQSPTEDTDSGESFDFTITVPSE